MSRQISTAISDLVLASTAIIGSRQISNKLDDDSSLRYAKWWFMLQMIAAGLGVINFARLLERHQESVEKYHRNFSWLCQSVGLPCLGANVAEIYGIPLLSKFLLCWVIINFLGSSYLPQHKDNITKLGVVVAVLNMLILAVLDGNRYLTTSSVFLILSGVIGDEGKMFGIPRVDIFHYVLAASNFFLSNGLLNS